MSDTVFTRDKQIRAAALTMAQTFYLTTLNQFIGKNPDAWPSQAAIAWAMNATARAVRNWQTELEELGVIQVDVGKGRSSTNRYRLNLDSLQLKEEPRSAFTPESEAKRGTTFLPNEEPRSYEKRNHVPTERTMKEQRKEQAFSFPPELNSEEFRTAWNRWVGYRREIGKKLAPSTVSGQLAKLAAWGTEKAIRSIEQSIANGWQGLFDPDGKTGKPMVGTDSDQAWQSLKQILRKIDKSKPYKELIRKQLKPEVYRAAETVGFSQLFSIDQFNESKLLAAFSTALNGGKNE